MATRALILRPGYFPLFDKGKPVANGYIYIGEPDLDPEIPANQKAITFLQEDGSEVAGSQPVRTSAGGVPTYNGSPVTVLVDGDYSVKVLDKHGSQVYYVPKSADLQDANIVTSTLNITTMKALTGLIDGQQVDMTTTGRAGQFVVIGNAVDFVAELAADPQEGVYIETADGKVLQRQYGQAAAVFPRLKFEWFYDDGETDHTAAIQGALNLSGYAESSGGIPYTISDRIIVPQNFSIWWNKSSVNVDTANFPDVSGLADYEKAIFVTQTAQRVFDAETAATGQFFDLVMDQETAESVADMSVLRPTNTSGIEFRGNEIRVYDPSKTHRMNVLWLDGCNNDWEIHKNDLKNECGVSPDGGGCIWISSINGYDPAYEQWTKRIRYYNNKIYQDTDDDPIALFCRQGVIFDCHGWDNEIVAGGTEQDVLISCHAILDFTPPDRANSTGYTEGDFITVSNSYFYKCVTAGTTAGSLPDVYGDPIVGEVITDGTAEFQTCLCGPRDCSFNDNNVKNSSATSFIVRIGRDLPNDIASTRTENITANNNTLENKSGTLISFVQFSASTYNCDSSDGVIRNNSLTPVTFGISGGSTINDNEFYGAISNPVVNAEFAERNTVHLPSGSEIKPLVQSARGGNNSIVIDGETIPVTGGALLAPLSIREIYGGGGFGGALNLCQNSNKLTGTGWTGSGLFTSFTENAADGVFKRADAALAVNNTGSTQTLTYTTPSTYPDGTYTAYIAVKNAAAASDFVNITIQGGADANQGRQYINGDDYTVAPITLTKSTGGNDALVFQLSLFDGKSAYLNHCQIAAGSLASEYAPTELNKSLRRPLHLYGTQPPTAGDWVRSDIIWNTEPSAGGVVGWICVSAGSPGTWKSFGGIAA